jgi:hypothetical protein
MVQAFRSLGELYLRADLVRLRSHAATIRSLLDELDRLVPTSGARTEEGAHLDLHEKVAEELARLGCRLLEYAATVTTIPPSSRMRA